MGGRMSMRARGAGPRRQAVAPAHRQNDEQRDNSSEENATPHRFFDPAAPAYRPAEVRIKKAIPGTDVRHLRQHRRQAGVAPVAPDLASRNPNRCAVEVGGAVERMHVSRAAGAALDALVAAQFEPRF